MLAFLRRLADSSAALQICGLGILAYSGWGRGPGHRMTHSSACRPESTRHGRRGRPADPHARLFRECGNPARRGRCCTGAAAGVRTAGGAQHCAGLPAAAPGRLAALSGAPYIAAAVGVGPVTPGCPNPQYSSVTDRPTPADLPLVAATRPRCGTVLLSCQPVCYCSAQAHTAGS